jgi:hypothetical protein
MKAAHVKKFFVGTVVSLSVVLPLKTHCTGIILLAFMPFATVTSQ